MHDFELHVDVGLQLSAQGIEPYNRRIPHTAQNVVMNIAHISLQVVQGYNPAGCGAGVRPWMINATAW